MKRKFTKLIAAAAATTMLIPGSAVNAKDAGEYADVSPNDWYYEYVADVSAKELMTGYEDGRFGVTDNLARGQFATVLYRMSGEQGTAFDTRFPDVTEGMFYSVPAVWANDVGVVTGYEDGLFGPADPITREQMATMLFRYAAATGMDVSERADYLSFPDGNAVSGFASDAMQWAIAKEIIRGNGDSRTLAPQGEVSRAVCATMISRFTGHTESEPENATPEEPQTDIVWLPATGKRFHKIPNCGRMNPDKARQTTMSEAIAAGYTACSTCY